MEENKTIAVHLGGSNRKLDRQIKAFAAANIPLYVGPSTGSGHHSNHHGTIPDTQAARDLLKAVGGTIRRQPDWLKQANEEINMKRMF